MKIGVTKRTAPLVFASFSCFLGTGAVLSILPLHLLHVLHASGFVLGSVLGVYPFAALLGRLLGGWTADNFGRRKTVTVGLSGACISAFVLLLPLTTLELFVVRFSQGLCQGALSVAVVTWMMDISKEDERAYSLAVIGAGVWGGTTIGVLLGGLMNSIHLSGLIAALSALIGIPGLRFAEAPPSIIVEKSNRRLLPKTVWVPGITFALGAVAYSAIAGFVVLHMNSRGASGVTVLTIFSLTVLFGRFIVVPMATRFGLQRSVRPAFLLAVIGLIVITAAHSTFLGIVGVALVALAHSGLWPALGSLVATRASDEERGSAMGLMTGLYDVAVGLSSLFFGIMATRVGTQMVFIVATGFVLMAIIFDTLFSKRFSLPATQRFIPL
jgi:MFS family permease